MNELSAPLRDIVRRAAERNGSGVAEKAKAVERQKSIMRAERVSRAEKGVRVLLCDYSGSMSDLVGGKRKIDHLRLAVADCLRTWPDMRIVAFSSRAHEVTDIPEPSGGTDLTAGLHVAAGMGPERTVVITDGYPNDRFSSLAKAKAMTGVIDVVYCGLDTDLDAIAFMQELAAAGCGRQVTWENERLALAEAVGMLMLEGA